MSLSITRVKICGITRNEDAQLAVQLGADAIGLNFYHRSARAIKVGQLAEILHNVPAFISRVALFVDPQPGEVEAVLAQGGISCLQFHGSEPVDFCRSFALPVIKAIAVRDALEAERLAHLYGEHCSILLDSFSSTQAGGTGKTFDWTIAKHIVNSSSGNIILAGGLNPANVAEAIATVQPYAVDVSSGVESSPGIKDPQKLRQFFAAVNKLTGN